MTNIFNYIDRPSPIHSLTGATKLVCVLVWTFAAMITYDTRVLVLMPVAAMILFRISRIRIRDVKVMLIATAVFCVLNNVMVFVFAPQHGVLIYGTRHVISSRFAYFVITWEQLFYHFNLILKYLATIPMVLLFVCTTDPSEFAASLNRIGVNYKIAYSVALALRYIPDIQKEYVDISRSQQARGIEMSKKESFVKRLKAASGILIPLIMSSIDRIGTIANAMELRGFGKNKKRSWYMARRFTAADIISMTVCAVILLVVLILLFGTGTRFYNPFV